MAERWISRAELLVKFSPYGCSMVAEIPPFELWETGWREPFTLQAENGAYDEWQVKSGVEVRHP